MKVKLPIYSLGIWLSTIIAIHGQSPSASVSGSPVPVTVDNFCRAETDVALAGEAKLGGFAKLRHHREPIALDQQVVPRINRDTLYSTGVFDLDAGAVTITMPDSGKRFMSLIVIDEDHYVHDVFYGPGRHTLSRDQIGTRYMFASLRTLVDPGNPEDLKAVHALQDASRVEQPSPGKFEVPNWDPTSLKKIHDALLVLNHTLPDLRPAFGSKVEVNPVRHLIGTASAWGGNPDKDAIYLNVIPSRNDGQTIYRLAVPIDVPVDGFWSLIVYDERGYIKANRLNAYNVNSVTAKKGADGSVVIQFGGCDGKVPNCIPIMVGWNYMVRLYRPRPEILNGSWKFPEAQSP